MTYVVPDRFVSLNRSTGAMTGHRKRHFALPEVQRKPGFAAKRAVGKTSEEEACVRKDPRTQWPERAGFDGKHQKPVRGVRDDDDDAPQWSDAIDRRTTATVSPDRVVATKHAYLLGDGGPSPSKNGYGDGFEESKMTAL